MKTSNYMRRIDYMRKMLSIMAITALLVCLLAGCAQSGASTAVATSAQTASSGTTAATTAATTKSGKTETVKIFSSVGAYKTKVEERVAEFNNTVGKEKGIFINLTSEIDNAIPVLETAIKSGNAPDLMSAAQNLLQSYADMSWIMDLGTIPEIADTVKKYAKYDVPMATSYKGKTYSLALEILPIKLVYNKDLFKKAGIVDASGEAKAPATWAEVASAAKKITEAGKGEYYGIGFSFGWSAGIRRLIFKPYIASLGKGWFDNVNSVYDFEVMRPALEFMMQIKKDGSYFPGIETIAIDPIRAQFADGKVGMEFAPAYDIAVYNDQFPAKCNWGVAEVPTIDPAKANKGVAILRGNYYVSTTVAKDRMWAVAEVFNYMHADEFYTKLYEGCAIIPVNSEIIKNAKNVQDKTGWVDMAKIDNYVAMPPYPDSSLTLEGDNFHKVFCDMFAGNITIDQAIEKCNKTYNDALKQAVKDGKVDLAAYKIGADYYKK